MFFQTIWLLEMNKTILKVPFRLQKHIWPKIMRGPDQEICRNRFSLSPGMLPMLFSCPFERNEAGLLQLSAFSHLLSWNDKHDQIIMARQIEQCCVSLMDFRLLNFSYHYCTFNSWCVTIAILQWYRLNSSLNSIGNVSSSI